LFSGHATVAFLHVLKLLVCGGGGPNGQIITVTAGIAMFPVDSSSSVRYAVASPPPPTTVTVKPHDKVESLAKTFQVTPEELARNNGIATATTLTEGQLLTLPANAVQPEQTAVEPQAAQTPKQKTDAAYTAYQQAQKLLASDKKSPAGHADINADIAGVAQAKQMFDAAVQAEIAGNVATANAGVPAQYQTPEKQQITQYGNEILARYAKDPVAQAEIKSAVSDYQVQRQADVLIPSYSGNWSAADKLKGIELTGQPQAVIDQLLANPQVQAWIKQAAADIGKPYNGMGDDKIPYASSKAEQASGNLAIATDGMPPQIAAALAQASMPTIRKIAQLELGQAGGMVPFDSVQSVLAHIGDGDQAKAVIQQVAEAYADNPGAVGFLTHGGGTSMLANTVVNSPGFGSAGNPAFAIALGNELQSRGQTDNANAAFDAAAQGVHDYLANNGDSPLKAYDSAHKAAQDKEQHLGELLAKAGPLTDTQKQAFIKAYRDDPDNAKVYKADAAAAAKLATYMETNKAGLIYAASHNPAAAQQLYSAMKDLAQSGQGKEALQFAGYVKNDAAATKAFSKFSDYQSDFLPKALEAAQGQLLVEDDGDTKEAGNELLELAEPVFKGQDGWDLVKENYARLASGDTKAFNAAEFAKGYSELGVAGKAWATVSVMTSSINGANAEQINAMIGAFATAGGKVDEVGTGAVQALSDAGKFGRYTESAADLAKFTAKFVPGLAVVASTAAFASDFGKAEKGNPAYAIALAGDVFAVLGSALETTGVGEIPGALLTGVGFLLSAPFELVGSLIDGNKEKNELQEEQIKYMEAAHIDNDEAELLAKDGDAINELSKQLDLTPQQAQQVLKDHPEAFGAGTGYTQGVIDVLKACQVRPGDVDDFLAALSKDDPNYINTFFNQRVATNSNGTSPQIRLDNLADLIGGGRYANTKAFVQARSSDVFSAAGSARRQADRDYGIAQSTGSGNPADIVNLLARNHDPAYQAQIIQNLKNDKRLDAMVTQFGSNGSYHYNGWPDALRSGILAAEGAGVISQEQGQVYVNELS
jgi:hypothetical protein